VVRHWQRGYLRNTSHTLHNEVTGNTGEGTGETGTAGGAVTGKSGEGIGSTGVTGVQSLQNSVSLGGFTNIVEISEFALKCV
jgi:hypothetical protein